MAAFETIRQVRDDRFVSTVARQVVAEAGARDARSRVIALRDYLRREVDFQGLPKEGRAFLRDSAGETLRSKRGYCGEVTRAFINMAEELGISATRINLYGRDPHVVAEAQLDTGERVIVDAQNPPNVPDLVGLDSLIAERRWTDYYTVNLRRLAIHPFVTRVKIEPGVSTYVLEKPYLLQAVLWMLLALLVVALAMLRRIILVYLRWRGWSKVGRAETTSGES